MPNKEVNVVAGSHYSSRSHSLASKIAEGADGKGDQARGRLAKETLDIDTWQPTSPSTQADPERDGEDDHVGRPWRQTGPTSKWTLTSDNATGGPIWTGLAPRPASGGARRTGSYSAPLAPEDIGLAVSHGAAARRRSRSAGELQPIAAHRLAARAAGPERRISEEIRYWRESVSAHPLMPLLSPLVNHGRPMDEDVAMRSRPASFVTPSVTRDVRLSAETQPWTTPAAGVRAGDTINYPGEQIASLQADLFELQSIVADLLDIVGVSATHVQTPRVANLRQRLARLSGSYAAAAGLRAGGSSADPTAAASGRLTPAMAQGQRLYDLSADGGMRSAFSSDKVSASTISGSQVLSSSTVLPGERGTSSRFSDRPPTAVFVSSGGNLAGGDSAQLSSASLPQPPHTPDPRGRYTIPERRVVATEEIRGATPTSSRLVPTQQGELQQRGDEDERLRTLQSEALQQQMMGGLTEPSAFFRDDAGEESASVTGSEDFITPTEDRTFTLDDEDEDDDNDHHPLHHPHHHFHPNHPNHPSHSHYHDGGNGGHDIDRGHEGDDADDADVDDHDDEDDAWNADSPQAGGTFMYDDDDSSGAGNSNNNKSGSEQDQQHPQTTAAAAAAAAAATAAAAQAAESGPTDRLGWVSRTMSLGRLTGTTAATTTPALRASASQQQPPQQQQQQPPPPPPRIQLEPATFL
jgi:HAMP domain-containing protein